MRLLHSMLILTGSGLLGVLVTMIAMHLYRSLSGPDLKPWHLADLDTEFHAERKDAPADLEAYLALEERLFDELRAEVYDEVAAEDRLEFNRFSAGSMCDPTSYPVNWNRTILLEPERPRGAVLLLHGLSDSPYSMRALAERLHGMGFLVLALRLPGHGTAPAGLKEATWKDFSAATRLGARSLSRRVGPDRPLYLAGYSNGASLAVEYALSVIEGEDLPGPEGLILISPAVGVSPITVLARWQSRLSALAGLEKLAWNSVFPEFDPYKYNSFAVNAGAQIRALTKRNAARIDRLDRGEGVKGFPPVLAFQSIADATISAPALVRLLMGRLAPGGHELVVFDVNRHAEARPFLTTDFGAQVSELMADAALPFGVTVVTNHKTTTDIFALRKPAFSADVAETALGLTWPPGVYSLSHVAVPFAPDDPIYAMKPDREWKGAAIGSVEPRGERGLLAFPVDTLMRLRSNPFFPYLEQRVLEFIGCPAGPETAASGERERGKPTNRGTDDSE